MKRRSWKRLSISAVLLSLPLQAQVNTASILGTVKDNTGAVVLQATVTAVQLETNFTRGTKTDSVGEYSIKFLPLGTYRLEVDTPGFKKFQQTGIVLEIGRNARVDAVLSVGAITESVSVTADAPLISTTDAALGRTVDNREVLSLPLVNRDLYALLNTTPGLGTSGGSVGNPEHDVTVNGTPNSMGVVGYYLDGGNNASPIRNTGASIPNPDAVREFRVITNSFGADFGRFSGGVIDVVTKSGTNALHGSLYEFLRNDALNANTWGASVKTPLRRNQFGGTLGGPIRKDHTFIFGSYSGLRQRQPNYSRSTVVPTALERVADFSQSKTKPLDPLTGKAFPNDIIPANRLDSTAMRILKDYIPLANLPGQFYEVTQTSLQTINELQFKVDHALAQAHQLAFSYFRYKGETSGPQGNLPWSRNTNSTPQHNFNLSETWTATPTTVNQFRLTYVRYFTARVNSPAMSLGDLGSKFQIQGTPSLPNIAVSGYFTLSEGNAGPIMGGDYYGLRETLTVVRGRHSLKMGGDFSLDKAMLYADLNNWGNFQFDGSKSKNALADFLMGTPRQMQQDAPIAKIDNIWYSGLYLQDDFRVHPRLTLNLGLRYDLQLPARDPNDRKVTFVPGRQSQVVRTAPLGLLFPGDSGVGRGIVGADKNNLAPRFGFAWDPAGDGKTSVRGAAGVFYSSISANSWERVADRVPFTVRQVFANVRSLTDPYADMPGGCPFPYVYDPKNPRFLPDSAVSAISLDFRWPYTYQLNFSVQRQLTRDMSITAAYVGTLSRKYAFERDANYPIYGPAATGSNYNQRRPYGAGQLAAVGLLESSMNGNYHGLQVSAERRMSAGVSFKGYYSYSKAIDTTDLQTGQIQTSAQNLSNLSNDRGRASNDRTHNFVMSVIWDIDYLRGGNAALRALVNGWSLSAIATVRSGAPLSVTTGRDTNLDGNSTDRANLVGNPFLDPNRPRNEATAAWFNRAAFAAAAAGQDGNSGRNILEGPGSKNADVGIFRSFKLRESIRLQFRSEITNALNLVNLSNPGTNMNSASSFGTILSAGATRQIQIGMRLNF